MCPYPNWSEPLIVTIKGPSISAQKLSLEVEGNEAIYVQTEYAQTEQNESVDAQTNETDSVDTQTEETDSVDAQTNETDSVDVQTKKPIR